MKFLFILPVLSDSYYQKRIRKLSDLGVICTVFGFEREHYKGKPWEKETTSLGRLKHGQKLGRIATLLKALFLIRKTAKQHHVIYCFGLDILVLGYFATLFHSDKPKLVYDLPDIHNILIGQNFIAKTLRSVEHFLLNRTAAVVVASPAFIDGYFQNIQKVSPTFVVIENKVESDLSTKPVTVSNDKLSEKSFTTIGYFGMIRCEMSLQLLTSLIKKNEGATHLSLWGIFLNTEKYKPKLLELPGVSYGGQFVYPDDLQDMYTSVDVVWAAHMHGETSNKWAISNRFYQACYFKCPLIVQQNTQDAKLVQKYNIGCTIDLRDIPSSIQTLQLIGTNQLKKWTTNMQNMPEEVYTLTNEHNKLLNILK